MLRSRHGDRPRVKFVPILLRCWPATGRSLRLSGPAAIEARAKLGAALDQFEKERIADVEDAGAGFDDVARRKSAEYVRQLHRLAADLRSKEFESSVDADALAERYRLPAIEQDIAHLSEPRP